MKTKQGKWIFSYLFPFFSFPHPNTEKNIFFFISLQFSFPYYFPVPSLLPGATNCYVNATIFSIVLVEMSLGPGAPNSPCLAEVRLSIFGPRPMDRSTRNRTLSLTRYHPTNNQSCLVKLFRQQRIANHPKKHAQPRITKLLPFLFVYLWFTHCSYMNSQMKTKRQTVVDFKSYKNFRIVLPYTF